MNADNAAWAVLFLAIVALLIVAGIAVGIIVARSIDRLQAPRPPHPAADPEPVHPAADRGRDIVQEDHQP